MQISAYSPVLRATTASPQPARPTSSSSGDSVSVGERSSWADSTLGRAAFNVTKGAALVGGIPALGALGAQLGSLGVVGALAGTAALGAYLGSTSDLDGSVLEKAAMGGAMAGLGCMISSVAGQVGGLGTGLMVAGTFGAIGGFRGVLETMAENNWI